MTDSIEAAIARAPWYRHALAEVGVKEAAGAANNPVIVDYWKDAKLAFIFDDNTPWCAGFVNAMLERAQVPGTKSAAARKFMKWGRDIATPALGCIVVLKRPPSTWQGHVGFYAGETATHVRILGGNQDNRVSFALFPKTRLLGYRWPAGIDFVPGRVAVTASGADLNPSDR